jgi:hypothetical protein
MSINTSRIGFAIGKSISATGSGKTSSGKLRHFSLRRLRNSLKESAETLTM